MNLGEQEMRTKELLVNIDSMSVEIPVHSDRVLVVVIDGKQGKAKITEAVEHGFTIIETAKGKAARIKFEESELF